ncbi:metalloendoproteinase 2-MMP-like [Quillaja saponaria]|uniref:Metalloendoproteinase 2-MMP-like n=1 Tax=Quillaja saponaria TaxID=32244 RepID=A0AAD7Q419_QUISA|nr:metalloendoproteinase 2-MMP-like [Quillaja saponaria]
MLIPRCGVPDIFHQKPSKQNNSTTSFRSNYSFFPRKQKWRPFKTHLTYSIHPVPKGFGIDRVRNACASAFQKWSAVSKFTFLEGSEGKKTDIVIGFYRGRHGDGHPFDGPGHILSHAFAPEDGRFHYDADEKWSDNPGRDEFDLESLALHEIGHLLGLEHSHDPGSVMVPSIGAGVTRRKLGQDDINGIRALYSG